MKIHEAINRSHYSERIACRKIAVDLFTGTMTQPHLVTCKRCLARRPRKTDKNKRGVPSR